MSLSTCPGFRHALEAVTMSPAVEKTRSDGTLVAGMAKYNLAILTVSWKSGSGQFHWQLAPLMLLSV